MKLRMEDEDGTQNNRSLNSLFVDWHFHKLFSFLSVSLNGRMAQSTELFGTETHLKMGCETNQRKKPNVGDLMMCHTNIRSTHSMYYDNTHFENIYTKYMIAKSHAEDVHMRGLLMLYLAYVDAFTLDGINSQLHLGFAPPSHVIVCDDATPINHHYNISLYKLLGGTYSTRTFSLAVIELCNDER